MAAVSGATAATTAQQQAYMYWCLFKHQLRLSTGLLQASYRRDRNVLLAPQPLISALATLVPGKDTEPRVTLARMLFTARCGGKMEANTMMGTFCHGNKYNLKLNAKAGWSVNTFHYSHPR